MGVVYYARYLEWFEVARTEWLRAQGRSYEQLEAEGLFLPVSEVWCRYRSRIGYADEVDITTWCEKPPRATIEFQYRVEAVETGRLVCEAHTRHPFVNAADGRPRRAPQWIRTLLTHEKRPETPLAADGITGKNSAENETRKSGKSGTP